VYPKVKLRQEHHQDVYEGGDVRDLGLKAFLSLSFHSPTSPGNYSNFSSFFVLFQTHDNDLIHIHRQCKIQLTYVNQS